MSDFDHSAGDKVSKSFCVLPWIHRFTNIGGEIQVCCVSEEFKNDIKNKWGQNLNISKNPDEEKIFNSGFLKAVRVQMMKGQWPPFCQRCFQSEQGQGTSRRKAENNRFRLHIEDLIKNTKKNGTLKTVKVLSADFRLGNLCNLNCRMCNPRSSSKWIREWDHIEHNWFNLSRKKMKEFSQYDWYKSANLWKNFKKQIPHLEHLHFAGGEPLLIPQMYQLLEMCIEAGRASSISLTYNTNMTLLPDKIKSLWPHFKEVRIFASIDAVGSLNNYIRYPSQWDQTDLILKNLDKDFKRLNLKEVTLTTTVQVYNILNIKELFDYTLSFKNLTPFPNLINLYNPEHYRTQVLPKDLKKEAQRRIEKAQREAEKHLLQFPEKRIWKFILESVKETIYFMNSKDLQKSHEHKLKKTILSKDSFRKQHLKEFAPELHHWISSIT